MDEAQHRGDRTVAPNLKSTREANKETHQAVTLEGCLQRASTNDTYLLTRVTEPALATAGRRGGKGSTVDSVPSQVVARTYRLEAGGELKLNEMVGRWIRVSGTVAEEPSGVARVEPDREIQPQPSAQKAGGNGTAQIDPARFAKISLASASVAGEKCE